jgi:hypothetical protein
LPNVPQDTLNFKLLIIGTSKKSSCDTIHPPEIEGKNPHLLLLGNLEEASYLALISRRYRSLKE